MPARRPVLTKADYAYGEVRDRIMSGALPHGATLSQEALAAVGRAEAASPVDLKGKGRWAGNAFTIAGRVESPPAGPGSSSNTTPCGWRNGSSRTRTT